MLLLAVLKRGLDEMGGLFGAVSQNNLAKDLFFGIDYHSHLGTELGGIAFLDDYIQTISRDVGNSQFKSEFHDCYDRIKGRLGIGVISDNEEEQPIKIESRIGTFALCTSGFINNIMNLHQELIQDGVTFKNSKLAAGEARINQTEIVAELISKGKTLIDGIQHMYEQINGYVSLLLLSEEDRRIYASGDTFPLVVGKRGRDWSIASETSSFSNLGYEIFKFIDYRELVAIDESGLRTRINLPFKRKFCPFLHIYYGFPASDYYGINAEIVRERCGGFLAENDKAEVDLVLGIADSGLAHSVGYVKRKIEIAKKTICKALDKLSKVEDLDSAKRKITKILKLVPPLRRPLVKYTSGWGRSYIPPTQEKRELIARYKQIPNPQLIREKKILLVDDSIRRGTQLQDLLRAKIWPYKPKEIHGRIASPPQMFPCIYDLASRNRYLATWKAILKTMGDDDIDTDTYLDSSSDQYKAMTEEIGKTIGFTTLKYLTLENMIKAVIEAPGNVDLKREDLCLYCWRGKV
jgi:amidophosphoribosyltransferase